MHARQVIVRAIYSRLKNELSEYTAQCIVSGFASLGAPSQWRTDGQIVITVSGEVVRDSGAQMSPRQTVREVSVDVVVAAKPGRGDEPGDAESKLDYICLEIETAIEKDTTLGGALESLTYMGTELPSLDDLLQQKTLTPMARLQFKAVARDSLGELSPDELNPFLVSFSDIGGATNESQIPQ